MATKFWYLPKTFLDIPSHWLAELHNSHSSISHGRYNAFFVVTCLLPPAKMSLASLHSRSLIGRPIKLVDSISYLFRASPLVLGLWSCTLNFNEENLSYAGLA
jgi:hypothetical protein